MSGYQLTETDQNRIGTAFHEAGHAVAGVLLGGRIYQVLLDDKQPRTEYDRLPAGSRASTSFAGPWSEARWTLGRRPGPADLNRFLDINTSDNSVLCAAGGPAAGAEIAALLERNWSAVKSVTSRLYFKGRADHGDICKALGLDDEGGPTSFSLANLRAGLRPLPR
ncbi:MAG: hypothetical protein HYZ38_04975 [Mycobacterium sp.]|nr:hypothetical protein [Mycobacterium sp.]